MYYKSTPFIEYIPAAGETRIAGGGGGAVSTTQPVPTSRVAAREYVQSSILEMQGRIEYLEQILEFRNRRIELLERLVLDLIGTLPE